MKSQNTTTLPVNYQALQSVSWFSTDSQNVQNWTNAIFRGGMNIEDPRLTDLINAANEAISQSETDITQIKQFLSQILPTKQPSKK